MADIGHILDKPPSTGITYYDETQEDVKVIMPDGNYKSNVISVETVVRDVKGIHRALIYNVKIRIASLKLTQVEIKLMLISVVYLVKNQR